MNHLVTNIGEIISFEFTMKSYPTKPTILKCTCHKKKVCGLPLLVFFLQVMIARLCLALLFHTHRPKKNMPQRKLDKGQNSTSLYFFLASDSESTED